MKIPAESQKKAVIPEKTVKNTNRAVQGSAGSARQTAIPANPARPPVKPLPADSSLVNLLSSLKLPQDKLSRSIVAFARFFSLPLEPKYLNSLRRAALGAGARRTEAAVLGNAAAADKGLKLDKKALAEYAAAIEGSMRGFTGKSGEGPDINRLPGHRENGGQQGGGGQQDGAGDDSRQEGGNLGGNAGQERQSNERQEQLSEDSIRQKLTETLNERPMLDLINRIPGNGLQYL